MQLRQAAGLSQAELARLVGESQQNVAYWELSDKPPRSDAIPKLAKVLGLRSSKESMDGSKVAAYHEAGRDAEIAAYCKEDVRLTRDVHRRMTFQA